MEAKTRQPKTKVRKSVQGSQILKFEPRIFEAYLESQKRSKDSEFRFSGQKQFNNILVDDISSINDRQSSSKETKNKPSPKEKNNLQDYEAKTPPPMIFPDLSAQNALKTGEDNLKSRVNETLRKLVNEYKQDYSNKILGYFIYLFYFSCAHDGQQAGKVKNGVVFLKLLKDLNSEGKKFIGKINKNPRGEGEVEQNVSKYLNCLRVLGFPQAKTPSLHEFMTFDDRKLIEHIFALYDFVCSVLLNKNQESKKTTQQEPQKPKLSLDQQSLLKLLESARKTIEKYKNKVTTQQKEITSLKGQIETSLKTQIELEAKLASTPPSRSTSDLNARAEETQNQPEPPSSNTSQISHSQSCEPSEEGSHLGNKSSHCLSSKRKMADEDEERCGDTQHEISMLNGEVSMLQDENDELQRENDQLVSQINDITFMFEAEIEKLKIEKHEAISKAQYAEEELGKEKGKNGQLEEELRDMKREIMLLKMKQENETKVLKTSQHLKSSSKFRNELDSDSGVTSKYSQEEIQIKKTNNTIGFVGNNGLRRAITLYQTSKEQICDQLGFNLCQACLQKFKNQGVSKTIVNKSIDHPRKSMSSSKPQNLQLEKETPPRRKSLGRENILAGFEKRYTYLDMSGDFSGNKKVFKDIREVMERIRFQMASEDSEGESKSEFSIGITEGNKTEGKEVEEQSDEFQETDSEREESQDSEME